MLCPRLSCGCREWKGPFASQQQKGGVGQVFKGTLLGGWERGSVAGSSQIFRKTKRTQIHPNHISRKSHNFCLICRIFTLTLDPSDYMDDCRPQFSSIEMPDARPLWVLGVPVLRKYVSVYDLSKRRVGFAEPGKGPRKRRAVRGVRFV